MRRRDEEKKNLLFFFSVHVQKKNRKKRKETYTCSITISLWSKKQKNFEIERNLDSFTLF